MKKTINILIVAVVVLFSTVQTLAQVPIPAPENQGEPIVLKGATAHLGNGEIIENSAIGFKEGKLTYVGPASGFNESGYTERNVAGMHVYPGFILPDTQIGIEEVSSVNAMSDSEETGEINPNVRAQIAFNTDSEFIPTMRFNGILTVESTPAGGIVSGTSAIMKMEGWNWEDATFKANSGIHINWPSKMRRSFDFNTFTFSFGDNPQYDDEILELSQLFDASKSYSQLASKEKNLKLEAMQGLFSGELNLVIHSRQAKSAVEGIKFAQKYGVKRIALAIGQESVFIADFLADNNIPVIVPSIYATPSTDDGDYDEGYKLAVELTKKGVDVSLSNTDMLGNARNLPFFAGTCVTYGLTKEQALQLITANPAKYLGVEDQLGTLEKGKNATLFVSEGDALDMRTNKLNSAFIDGREVTLEARQQWLYKKYSDKYGHN